VAAYVDQDAGEFRTDCGERALDTLSCRHHVVLEF
jgi:hypothetical protein